jgi:hypothetical protein
MLNPIKLQKGSTFKNRGIIKWDDEIGSYVVGNRLNFVFPINLSDRLFSQTNSMLESGGLLIFELLPYPPRTLIAKDIIDLNNISTNPQFEFCPDHEEVKKIIFKRSKRKKLFLPAFFHIHPVMKELSNIQHDFYLQAGPSQEDIATTFFSYPFLQDGKLTLPEFILCRHPIHEWIFVGFYDCIRLEAIDIQRNFLQQEHGLRLVKEVAPSIHSLKKRLNKMDLGTMALYALIGYSAYKMLQPQVQQLKENVEELINAEANLRLLETQTAVYDRVPFYTVSRPGEGCVITLPGRGHHKKIIDSTSRPRVLTKVFKEIKKLIG